VWFALVLAVLLLLLVWVRERSLQVARQLEISGDFREALSLFWAWGTDADVARIIRRIEPDMASRFRGGGDPWLLVTAPANAAAILVILCYQAIRRRAGRRVCLYWPNCSAYGLGAMRRRNVIKASSLVLWRVRSCNGASDGLDIYGWL
jgi:putative component of membrane protein insertase Oxa1/YidC/SpoIIIJ protein YidD